MKMNTKYNYEIDKIEEQTNKFYEERRKRSNTTQHHNLLKKNVSFFNQPIQVQQQQQKSPTKSFDQHNKQNIPTHDEINKKRMGQKQNNSERVSIEDIKQKMRKSVSRINGSLQQIDSRDNKPLPKFGYTSQTTNFNKSNNSYDDDQQCNQYFKHINKYQEQPSKKQSITKTPQFQIQNKDIKALEDKKKRLNYIDGDKKQKLETYSDQRHKQMEQRIEHLEKIAKYQNKFIESIQKMRKTILNIGKQCSLKQLWQWIKTLPNYEQLKYRMNQ